MNIEEVVNIKSFKDNMRDKPDNTKEVKINFNGELLASMEFTSGRCPWELYSIYTLDKCRKLGIGKCMIKCLELYAKENRCKSLFTLAEDKKIDFFKKCGFEFIENEAEFIDKYLKDLDISINYKIMKKDIA